MEPRSPGARAPGWSQCGPAGASAPARVGRRRTSPRRPPVPVPGAALGLAAPALLRKVGAPAGPLRWPRARACAGPRCLSYPLGVSKDPFAPAAPARPGHQPLAGFAIVVRKAVSGQGLARLELASAGKSISVQSDVGGEILSPDPMDQFWNPYSYVGGSPLTGVDPWGLAANGTCVDAPVVIPGTVATTTPGQTLPQIDPGAMSSTDVSAMEQHFSTMTAPEPETSAASVTPSTWYGTTSKALTFTGLPVSAADWMKNGATGARALGSVKTGASSLGRGLFYLSIPISAYSIMNNRNDKALVGQGLLDFGLGLAGWYFTGGVSLAASLLAATDAGVDVHGQFSATRPMNSSGLFVPSSDASAVQLRYPAWYRMSLPNVPSLTARR